MGLSEATNKAVLLNSALSSLKACCFCFLCTSIFLKPSIGMFLVVLFPSLSLSFPLAVFFLILLLSFVRSKRLRSVTNTVIPEEKRGHALLADVYLQMSFTCFYHFKKKT